VCVCVCVCVQWRTKHGATDATFLRPGELPKFWRSYNSSINRLGYA